MIPNSSVKYVGDGIDTRSYRVDFGKIVMNLGFSPKWVARSGAEQLYSAYKTYQLRSKSSDGRYVRLNTVKEFMDKGYLDEDLRWVN